LIIDIEFKENVTDEFGIERLKHQLSPMKAYDILKNISDIDVKILGFNMRWTRPEWLIVSVLPVPPPHVRPTVSRDGLNQNEDDLTHAITNIVKDNLMLENSIRKGDSPHIIEEFEKLLQFRVTAFFDNERADVPHETHRSGRPLKTIRQRLKGKEGRLRGNLMGKRVDFSARTVITADPNLSIDQVGVPRSIAIRLTVPVRVTRFNIDELRTLVQNGPDVHPGAQFIVRNDGSRIDLRYVGTTNLMLEYGWTIERHLADDDIILFNRQPSLHKMSIMGHRVKVLDYSTFRLNLSVTTPYNADFDGDEMNLHVPQSLLARADAELLMLVSRNIITPQNNRNVMGIVQDALLASHRISKRDIFIGKDFFMNILMWVTTWDGKLPIPAILKPVPLWTGKQVFSLICPPINYRRKGNTHPDKEEDNPLNIFDSEVYIQDGELLMGILDKCTLGMSQGSLIHITWLEKGWEETRRFMDQLQQVMNYWMLHTSFSISISDTVADSDTMKTVSSILDKAKEKVREFNL
jgi:DNA-directed RNA polymerase II subunit RPB1